MQLEVLNIKGKKTGRQVNLPEDIFGATPNDHVIYLAVKQYLAARRSGTHKVKLVQKYKGLAENYISKKVLVVLVRVISVTHYTKVVVLFLDQNHIATILN